MDTSLVWLWAIAVGLEVLLVVLIARCLVHLRRFERQWQGQQAQWQGAVLALRPQLKRIHQQLDPIEAGLTAGASFCENPKNFKWWVLKRLFRMA